MLLLAHRGASADAPENTLAAFREAAAQGADGVELDVMLCGSGEVVVCHDERLDRLAGLDWEVAATPWEKLKAVDVGTHLGFPSAGIPLLEEVVRALPERMLLNIELKCDALGDRGLSAKVARFVAQAGLSGRVLLSSFNPLCLRRAARAQPELKRGFLIDPDKSFVCQDVLLRRWAGRDSVHPHFSECTEARARRWKQAGLKIAVWTVDNPDEARRLQTLGVDYCITNRPGALRKALL